MSQNNGVVQAIEAGIRILAAPTNINDASVAISDLSDSLISEDFKSYFEQDKNAAIKLFIAAANSLTDITYGNNQVLRIDTLKCIARDQLKSPILPILATQLSYRSDKNDLRSSVSKLFSSLATGFVDTEIQDNTQAEILTGFEYKLKNVDFSALRDLSANPLQRYTIPDMLLDNLGQSIANSTDVNLFNIKALEVFSLLAQDAYVQKNMTQKNKTADVNLITPDIAAVKEENRIDIYTRNGKLARVRGAIIAPEAMVNITSYGSALSREEHFGYHNTSQIKHTNKAFSHVSMLHHCRSFHTNVLDTQLELPYYNAMQRGIKACSPQSEQFHRGWNQLSKAEIVSRGMTAPF